jgi:hypothetical protein
MTKNNLIDLYVDSEWGSDNRMLSYQVMLKDRKNNTNQGYFIITEENLLTLYKKNIEVSTDEHTEILSIPNEDCVLEYLLNKLSEAGKIKRNMTINLHFYYSIRDLEFLVGKKFLLDLIDKKMISKRNNLKGHFITNFQDKKICFKLKDKSGWVKRGGLKGLLETLAINHASKTSLDEYKTCMERCFESQELVDTFVNYAMEDVNSLSKTDEKMIKLINEISLETLKIPTENLFTIENTPDTIGSCVARILDSFIKKEITNNIHHDSQEGMNGNDPIIRFEEVMSRISLDSDIIRGKNSKKKSGPISDFLNGASIKSFGFLHNNTTGLFNTLVQGGRTFNERNDEYLTKNLLDLDLQSCYANSLKNLDYPVGLPTVYAVTDKEDSITLREFLKKNQDELVPNLYTITISGKLSYDQTLLYSKLATYKKLSTRVKKLIMQEEVIEGMTGDFVILTKQLENTIITSDILKTLKKVCNHKELKEIYDCQVVTAAYYKRSDFIESKDEWLQWMEKHVDPKKDYSFDVETQGVNDKRSRKWTKIGLNDFFEPLIEKRKELKQRIKILEKDSKNPQIQEEVNQLKGLEQMVKLISNTVYGVLASPYFNIGNTIIANTITGRARNDIWLYSRSLGGYLSITDGFAYTPGQVFKNTPGSRGLPGLRILSDFKLLAKHGSIKTINLQEVEWEDVFLSKNPNHPDLLRADEYAKKHIESFIAPYGLKMNFDIEHKLENTASKMFSIKKAHYILERFDTKEIVHKIRGTNIRENPVYLQIAKQLFQEVDEEERIKEEGVPGQELQVLQEVGREEQKENHPLQLEVESKRITTIADYINSKNKIIKNMNNPSFDPSSIENQIEYPGRNKIETKIFRLNSLDLPYSDIKEYKYRNSVKGNKDYGPLLKTKSFHEVFEMRLQEYFIGRKILLEDIPKNENENGVSEGIKTPQKTSKTRNLVLFKSGMTAERARLKNQS